MAADNCSLKSEFEQNTKEDVRLGTVASGCELRKEENGTKVIQASGYAFETLSFDVVQSLNRAAKQAFDNLNVKVRVSNFADLNPRDLLNSILNARHLIPHLMKYLATYRDVSLVMGKAVVDGCAETNCTSLREAIADNFDRSRTSDFKEASDERPILKLLSEAKKEINNGFSWKMGIDQMQALVFYIDLACRVLYAIQTQEETDAANIADCRCSTTNAPADAFLEVIDEKYDS